jgi:hypothetical protein
MSHLLARIIHTSFSNRYSPPKNKDAVVLSGPR